MYVRVRFLSAPLHPLLVVYPVVLYAATFVAFLIYRINGELFWFRIGHLANKAGVLLAVVTALPWIVGWVFGLSRRVKLRKDDLWYMLLNGSGLVLFVATAFLDAGKWESGQPDIGIPLILSFVGILLTAGAGLYGWTLVPSQRLSEAAYWQVRAERLADELKHVRAQLEEVRGQIEELRTQRILDTRAAASFGEPEQPPTWSAMASQAWAAIAGPSWSARADEISNDTARLILATIATLLAVVALGMLTSFIGLK